MATAAPVETEKPRYVGLAGPETDLTARQRARLRKRARERRRLTPQALALRVKAVGTAYRAGDKWALVGALEDLASACMAWATYIRSTSRF